MENSMSKVMVEMQEEQIDAIVLGELSWHFKQFKSDLELRERGEGMSIFDNNPKADAIYIKEYIEAFGLVLDYFGGSLQDE
jgi:hypothetical protein